jgi:hypothetical protein
MKSNSQHTNGKVRYGTSLLYEMNGIDEQQYGHGVAHQVYTNDETAHADITHQRQRQILNIAGKKTD